MFCSDSKYKRPRSVKSIQRRIIVASFTLLIMASPLQAWASPDVNPKDQLIGLPYTVSEGLAILNATGCTPSYMTGDAIRTTQRIAKLLVEYDQCVNGNDKKHRDFALARRIWKQLTKQYPVAYQHESEGTKPAWNEFHYIKPNLRVTTFGYVDDERIIPSTDIDASISPWTSYREGTIAKPGITNTFSMKGSLSLGSWFDFQLEPLLTVNVDEKDIDIHSGTIKLTWRNFEFKGGRSPLYWGPPNRGNVLFSGNTKPMELVQIGSPYPFKWPVIGRFMYRVFFSYISDNNRYIPHPFILGARIMIKPHPLVEVGLSRALMFGGKGSPGFFPLAPLVELTGFRPWEGWIFNIPIYPAHNDSGFANNLTSIDVRVRIPPLRNSEFYFEYLNEDPFDTRDWLAEDSIYHGGIWIPRLTPSGKWQLRVEATYTGNIVYCHGIFKSGFTNRRRIMGSSLGPDAVEIYTWASSLLSPRTKLWSSFSYQHYFTKSGKFNLFVPANPVSEKRAILSVGIDHAVDDHLMFHLTGGFEEIRNFNFISGNDKRSALGEFGIRYQF
jgi:hypothetical protein